jgi:hypothetical protein
MYLSLFTGFVFIHPSTPGFCCFLLKGKFWINYIPIENSINFANFFGKFCKKKLYQKKESPDSNAHVQEL